MEEDVKKIIEQFVDYLSPELTPYEASFYLYLFRNSLIRYGNPEIRVGKRTIAAVHGKAARGEKTAYAYVTKVLQRLEQKGCIIIGDANRFGTLYTVILPEQIPLIAQKIASSLSPSPDDDYFINVNKRLDLFERDKWICQYCGDRVNQQNATLDHFIPRSKGGDNSKDNLKTCCLICNSMKSGKSYEEAAPLLLKSIQERKARHINKE